MGTKRNILIIVQNLPVPFDRRVWQEATSLRGMASAWPWSARRKGNALRAMSGLKRSISIAIR